MSDDSSKTGVREMGDDTPAPAAAYMLADHLDAVLAAGEDLAAVGQYWDAGDPCDPGVASTQRWAIGRIRSHEMTLLAHLLRAREAARELAKLANDFRLLAHLFVSGTTDLADAVDSVCDAARCAFENGEDATAYLRSRGLLEADAPGLRADQALNLGDAFVVFGRVPLGIVLDLVAELMHALDVHYELYPDESDGAAVTAETADLVAQITAR